jgi:hypothetical protein
MVPDSLEWRHGRSITSIRKTDMRRIALLFVLFTLAACNNDATSPSGSVVGSYSLETVNGNPLPYTFSNGAVLVSDHLTLNSDGSYLDVTTYSTGAIQSEQGVWSLNNNLITFDDQTDQITYTGSVSGTVLTETFNNAGYRSSVTEVYARN